ncbi:MAG: hypothetical protein IKB70_04815 [Bacilli bacterium]|nr:hypothetical protein [Bacilli bacterium]
MKKPSVTTIKKYLAAILKIKAKYVTSERLSKVLGVYPETINETLSYFDPMICMDYSYNLMDLVETLKEFVENDDNKQDPIDRSEAVYKSDLAPYESIMDFLYQKYTIAGGLIDKNARLSDADLRILKKLVLEEIAKRKKK